MKLSGDGASFPAPLYSKWFKDYAAAHPDVLVDYQSKGSGAGVTDFTNKVTDFGASDAAMTPEEVAKVDAGVVLLPMTAGSIVLAYHLDGVTDLKLSRAAMVGIFSGKITKWSDAAIKKTNPDAKLPDTDIAVQVRSDGSGTSFVFTKHLAAVSEDFKKTVGENKLPAWPDKFTKSKGNEGVAQAIQQNAGSIGYVEYGYAKNQQMTFADIENKAGKMVKATAESAQAALAAIKLPDNLVAWGSDPEGDACYPIASYTWIMVYKTYPDAKKWDALKKVLDYCLTTGQKDADGLGYVPLPADVVAKDQAALATVNAAGGAAPAAPKTDAAPKTSAPSKG
jgi:phosphate transport system substrate-binding protein